MAKKENIYWVYVKWLALPKNQRLPKTNEEFLQKYDLLPADLFSFQESKEFADDLNKETMRWAKRKTPEMLHLLYQKYQETKNPADLKIWQEAIRDHDESQVQTTLNDLVEEYEVTENQLTALAYRILALYDPKGLMKDELMILEK